MALVDGAAYERAMVALTDVSKLLKAEQDKNDSLVGAVAARDQALDALESRLHDYKALADTLADKVDELRQMIIDICDEEGLEPPKLAEYDILAVLALYPEMKRR